MNKIKIVHVVGKLARGGAERFVVDLCNELSKNEIYEVYLISLCRNDVNNSFLRDIDTKIHYLSLNKGSGFSLATLLKLTRFLSRERVQVVHTHLNAFEYLLLYRFINNDSKFFHTIHSTAETECPNLLIKLIRKSLYKSNKIKPVAISKDGSESFERYYGLNNNIVIENGRPFLTLTSQYPLLLKKYRDGAGTFLLVHVGRVSKEKNQQLLIDAVQKFNREEEKKCKLLIIGDLCDQSLYKSLNEQVKDDHSIEFLGGKDNVADYLSIADFFCLSSHYEGMPISLIEAMSVGCISVCTIAGGIKNMISDKHTGFLSSDNSVDTYYRTIKDAVLFHDKEKIRENSINAFKMNYHIGTSARRYSEAYSTALNNIAAFNPLLENI